MEHVNCFKILVTFSLLLTLASGQDCLFDQFKCTDGSCISQVAICDGVNDCRDWADETRALCVTNGTCINGLFICNQSPVNIPPFCLKNISVCDGTPDCLRGEDELSARCDESNHCHRANSFRCSDNQCILGSLVCDGFSDCPAGWDELNCTKPACPAKGASFNCSYGWCISADLTCNGAWDCRDGSDEDPSYCNPNITCPTGQFYCSSNRPGEQCVQIQDFCSGVKDCSSISYKRSDCGVNMCERDTPCGSSSQCVNLDLGYECVCNHGYELTSDKKSCQDVDECTETPWVCDQLCMNTQGDFQCSCAAGYSLTNAPGTCTRDDTSITPVIYFGHRDFISSIYLDGSNYQPFALSRTFVHVLDFDWMTRKLFHFDVQLQALHVMNLNGTEDTMLDRVHSSSVEGIAIDWIHRKILWTSTLLMGIYASEMNGSFVTPIVAGVSPNCRSIAVHPKSRYIYWTDWGVSPFIARIGLDGSLMQKLITTGLFWPNGITVDYVVDRFWWVDAFLDHIEYADLDGSHRRVLVSQSISHPYSITVFESLLFWSDWNYKSLNVTNRYTGEYMPPLLTNLPIQPYDVKVLHPVRQPPMAAGINPCKKDNGGCSHQCLPSPLGPEAFQCACPDGKPLLTDEKTCSINCSSSEFECNDGVCIPWYYKCNGQNECRNGDDEPNTCPHRRCAPNMFECGQSQGIIVCLSLSNVCDGLSQCADDSDEDIVRCSNRVCQLWEFLCTSTGRCIPQSWACDNAIDCALGEDEAPNNPSCEIMAPCKDDEFRCNNTKCIPQFYYCDVDDDCGDRSDEPDTCLQYRSANPCPAGYERCPKNYRCIPITAFCDGLMDCRDGSDELPESCKPCKNGEFTCKNKHCIPLRWQCDFGNDCGDNSDEDENLCRTLYRNCTIAEFRCNNSRCLNSRIKCDGNNDCGDGSDEDGCGGCPAGQFQCDSKQCIPEWRHCDGSSDCSDMSDEYQCPTRYPGGKYCQDDQFTCNNTLCIEKIHICDQTSQCGDGTDETDEACESVKCPPDTFQCTKVRNCLPLNQVCDGTPQCEYSEDEKSCVDCEARQLFRCNESGECIDPRLKCNHKYDCGDGLDELNCWFPDCSSCQQNCTIVSADTLQATCSCWTGYNIDPANTGRCIGQSYCEVLAYNWCPHTCVSLKREQNETYRCLCAEGFEDLNGDGRTCQPLNGLKGTVIYGLGHRILAQNITHHEVIEVNELPDVGGGDIVALDVDARKRIAYWVDKMALYRAAIPMHDVEMAYVQKIVNISQPTGLAYDWITGNVYWSDTNGVYVTSKQVYWLPKTLVHNTNSDFRPSRVTANPKSGMLFFINDYEGRSEIMSMGMNGENMRSIVTNQLHLPADLAVDLASGERLYWTDSEKDSIESCTYNGSDRTLHVTDVKHPYRLDLFSGKFYWTTTDKTEIRMAGGMGKETPTAFLDKQTNVGPIKYIHELKYNQYTKNKCESLGCQFCLLGPGEPECACPDGYQLKANDPKLCDIPVPPGYIELEDPKLCSCQNDGYCDLDNGIPKCVCPSGFSGDVCDQQSTGPSVSPPFSPPTSGSYISPMSSPGSVSPPVNGSSVSPGSSVSSTMTSSTTSSSNGSIPTVSAKGNSRRKRDISIALPIVFGLLVLILCALLLWTCMKKRKQRPASYGRHIDDSSSVASYSAGSSSPREPVAFQGDGVHFGNDNHQYSNPMYKEMAVTLDPPPYAPMGDNLEKRDPSLSVGYNQPNNPSNLTGSSRDLYENYDQIKPLEFANYPNDKA